MRRPVPEKPDISKPVTPTRPSYGVPPAVPTGRSPRRQIGARSTEPHAASRRPDAKGAATQTPVEQGASAPRRTVPGPPETHAAPQDTMPNNNDPHPPSQKGQTDGNATVPGEMELARPGGANRGAPTDTSDNSDNRGDQGASGRDSQATHRTRKKPGDDHASHALSDVLDRLEGSLSGKRVGVDQVIEALGHSSFASLMLVFALICTSPASAIPGVTSFVAAIIFVLAVQMILGRDSLWLPGFLTRRRISTDKLCDGIAWLRKPVSFVERFLKPRLTFLFHRPWLWLPLSLVLAVTLMMPVMEFVPTSGSIASGVIALFAASLLTRDGVLAVLSLVLLSALPLGLWWLAPIG